MHLHTVGIDIGKTSFHLVGMDGRGAIIVRKRLSRPQLVTFLANVAPTLIGMEASVEHIISALFWRLRGMTYGSFRHSL
jgi:predicted NBD/HSP70 family sugar kinase